MLCTPLTVVLVCEQDRHKTLSHRMYAEPSQANAGPTITLAHRAIRLAAQLLQNPVARLF
jgi:hypothetical protein